MLPYNYTRREFYEDIATVAIIVTMFLAAVLSPRWWPIVAQWWAA